MLADIFALNANRHKNIVIAIIISKILFSSFFTISIVLVVVGSIVSEYIGNCEFIYTVKPKGSDSTKLCCSYSEKAVSEGSFRVISSDSYSVTFKELNYI